MTSVELVNFLSSDLLRLPGVLYKPQRPTKKVAIWLHGMGDNGIFYNAATINELGDSLANQDISLFAFNNRGAHLSKSLRILNDDLPIDEQHIQAGTYYELIKDCVLDIDGALELLKDKGFSEFYLIGISTGANKICSYHALAKNNPFSKYVLASPGDDTGLHFNELGEKKYYQAINDAKSYIEKGKPLHTMPIKSGMNPFSAQSAMDNLNPEGDYNTFPYYEATKERLGKKPLFKELSTFDKPFLTILGEQDEWLEFIGGSKTALSLLKQYTPQEIYKISDYKIIPNADHSFQDQEHEFAETVAKWLAR